VDHHQVAHLQVFVLQQEQAGVALDATRFTAGIEAVDFDDSHGYAQAHDRSPTNSCLKMNLIQIRMMSIDQGQDHLIRINMICISGLYDAPRRFE